MFFCIQMSLMKQPITLGHGVYNVNLSTWQRSVRLSDILGSQAWLSGHTKHYTALGASACGGARVAISFFPHQSNMIKVWIMIKRTILSYRSGASFSFPMDYFLDSNVETKAISVTCLHT